MAFPSLKISKFSGGACPQIPLADRTSGARVPPHLYYPCYGTAIPVFQSHLEALNILFMLGKTKLRNVCVNARKKAKENC